MNHSIDHSHQDSDLFGLLYGFRFRPGEKGEQIDSATALKALQQPDDPEEFLWLHLNLAHGLRTLDAVASGLARRVF